MQRSSYLSSIIRRDLYLQISPNQNQNFEIPRVRVISYLMSVTEIVDHQLLTMRIAYVVHDTE